MKDRIPMRIYPRKRHRTLWLPGIVALVALALGILAVMLTRG